jgi:DHA1 family tetracycline resistance protein-like MFS transporter
LVVVVQLGVIPLMVRRVSEIHMAIAGAVLSILAFGGLALFTVTQTTAVVYAAVVLFGLGQPMVQTGLTSTMSMTMGADIQGRVQGAIAATMALAQVVGPLLIGWLYQAAGPAVPYVVVALQITVSIALLLAALPRLNPTTLRGRVMP